MHISQINILSGKDHTNLELSRFVVSLTKQTTVFGTHYVCLIISKFLHDILPVLQIKMPTVSDVLSALKVQQVCGGSKSLFAVTIEGKVLACGESTNGRLGLGPLSANVVMPRQIEALSRFVVKKVAVHSGGRHAMAITTDGKMFSWGEGEDGKLGHGNKM